MNNRFKIEFRHKQLYMNNDTAQPILVDCVGGVPVYTTGFVPGHEWLDVTEYTGNLDQLSVNWSAVGGANQESGVDEHTDTGSNFSKGLSADLIFYDVAFKYVFDWLMTSPCQILNAIEVKISDLSCQKAFRLFELKCDNIKYKPVEESCLITVPLREADDAIHAFSKTIIEDDWQNWFNKKGAGVKDHPTFQMIVEKKPKFFLAIYVALIYIVGMLSVGLLLTISGGKKWIRRCLGFTYFCPSPLIRTYIENICAKYGFTFSTMFDNDPANDYRDVCLFWPASTSLKNFEGFNSPSTKFIWENRTGLPFTKFLDQLKLVFNAEWYVTPNKQLVFRHKSYFNSLPPLYDFTVDGNDKLWNLEYTFNGTKKPAYGDYQYKVDPQDTCSNEVKYRYNTIVDYDGPANNPMLEGNRTKLVDFGMTAFHNDGSSSDFLEEGVRLGRTIAEVGILIGLGELFLATNPLTVAIVIALVTAGYIATNDYINDFFNNVDLNGMVRVSSSEINVPRLLLWDRTTPIDKAKVVSVTNPPVNAYYNPDATDYYTEHPTFEDAGYFGTTVTKVWNYPMFFEEKFTGNIYTRFHDIDNPLVDPRINQTWTGEVDLCCDWMNRLGCWENDFIKIGSVVTLEKRGVRTIKGRIDKIEPNYKTGRISLTGTVLK